MSGTIDTSSYKSFVPPKNNLLEMAQGAANLQNQTNQNLLFQQQFNARQAMGQVLQGAIDKDSGKLDPQKAFLGMATNPATAFMAPDFYQNLLRNGQIEAETMRNKIANAQSQLKLLGDHFAPLLAQGDNVKRADADSVMQYLATTGQFTPQQIRDYIGIMPRGGPELAGWLKQVALGSIGAGELLKKTAMTIDTGSQVLPGAFSPYTGQLDPSAPPLDRQVGPETRYGPQPVTNANGSRGISNLDTEVPGLPVQGGQSIGGGGGGNRGTLPVVPRGPAPPPLNGVGGQPTGRGPTAPAAPGAPPAPPATGQGARGISETALPEHVTTYLAGQGPMADYERNVNKGMDAAQKAIPILRESINILPKIASGFGAETRAQVGNFLNTFAKGTLPDSTIKAIAGGDVAQTQIFMKDQLLNVLNIMNSSGMHPTDFSFSEMKDKIMSVGSDPKALASVAKTLLGMSQRALTEGVKMAEVKSLATMPQDPAEIPTWKARVDAFQKHYGGGGVLKPYRNGYYFDPAQWPAFWNKYVEKYGKVFTP